MTTENSPWRRAARWLGIDTAPQRHRERLISGLGGLFGIFAVGWVSIAVLGPQPAALMIVASMGASAVLLFAVPHGPLSQPWPLIGGHLLSALVGVTVAHWVPDLFVAGALAVGFAISVMHYARCLHPPGGATALSAVIGGEAVHALGYGYVLTPVLLNVIVMLVIALVFNALFPWRRYPAALARALARPAPAAAPGRSDYAFALREADSFVDVSEEDLERLFALASAHAARDHLPAGAIRLGGVYSNGRYGHDWQVRQVIDESQQEGARDRVIYRVLAGAHCGESQVCAREAFARWARYEVEREGGKWRRKGNTE
jgi:CBS-domain-containing membrane protein